MLNYYTPLIAVIIAIIIFTWVICIVMSLQREGLEVLNLNKWKDTPVILPTDSVVGPRIIDQNEILQVANGGDRRIWVEWRAFPAYYSYPFYPDSYVGDQEIVKTAGGGRLQLDPAQYILFPSNKRQIEGIRLWPLMGCTDKIGDCEVGASEIVSSFEFSFNPPGGNPMDWVVVSAESGITLPFNLSYFSETGGATSMICSLPPPECPDELKSLNENKKFVGCSSVDQDVYTDLLAQNCIITQSPSHELVGSKMFKEGGGRQSFYTPSLPDNRFKLTFYDTGFEWVQK